MKNTAAAIFLLTGLMTSAAVRAQIGSPVLPPDRAADWSNTGVGAIPARPTICARLTPSADLAQIDAALRACPKDQTVYLEAGAYAVPGTIHIPSHVTLRGAGADRTILNATGKGRGYAIAMGSDPIPFKPIDIVRGATHGSTAIVLAHATGVRVGGYLAISESNDPDFVSSLGDKANCDWCDGGWSKTGQYARGQIVEVKEVRGDRVAIAPGLYGGYTHSPFAVPFEMSEERAGVEDLQVYANNTGYEGNFAMIRCAYCWVKGVESNYSDADLVTVLWGYRDEVRDSYFSNNFRHAPGSSDSGIHVAYKTSASLFENNIVERARVSFDLGWGAAGNVFAYNYTMGEFIADAPDAVIGGFRFHGGHSQFNLFEGNVTTEIDEDSVWGTTSHTTAFRNWIVGTNRVCTPLYGRGHVDCSGPNGHYGFQAARAVQISYRGSRNVFAGNVLGSVQMQSLDGHGHPLQQVPFAEYPTPRSYVAAAYGWTFGYGGFTDTGSGTGCGGAKPPPCHLSGTSSSNFFHGNFNNVDGSVQWAPGAPHRLPASLYLAGKPSWWGAMPFPPTGPDVIGGPGPRGHSYGNPAQACYLKTMGGTDGGPNSPLIFNAARCYGGRNH